MTAAVSNQWVDVKHGTYRLTNISAHQRSISFDVRSSTDRFSAAHYGVDNTNVRMHPCTPSRLHLAILPPSLSPRPL